MKSSTWEYADPTLEYSCWTNPRFGCIVSIAAFLVAGSVSDSAMRAEHQLNFRSSLWEAYQDYFGFLHLSCELSENILIFVCDHGTNSKI